MDIEDKKAAVRAYKERKIERGIYAVRCAASGDIWVGYAADLSKIQNRLWFTLRQGTNPRPSLQGAWTAHGCEAFSFDVLERLDEDDQTFARDRAAKLRLAHWTEQLRASPI
jgi:hypothetical protein